MSFDLSGGNILNSDGERPFPRKYGVRSSCSCFLRFFYYTQKTTLNKRLQTSEHKVAGRFESCSKTLAKQISLQK
ncbi:unnamed protein product [Allacma fusca]|uniref:Uncharacterized protein n=1 Tax=Allacma fusca TaxID=39272 RepID=A0A8J2KVT9_9HEXA|nr:unnamed protein product [Allacma fusca]